MYRLGELFCGPGGFGHATDLAAKSYRGDKPVIKHVWATDMNKDSCATYTKNFLKDNPELKVYPENIKDLDLHSLDAIDVLTFGFPCNDFSIVGEQKGLKGSYGALYRYGIKALEILKPDWFIAENVGGLRNANDGSAFFKILTDLENVKPEYSIIPHYYKFEEYGVPQKRHRVVIVGIRACLNKTFKVPAPTTPNNYVSVRAALKNIPKSVANQELTRQSSKVIARLKAIDPGKNAWNSNLSEELRLNVKGAKLSQIYRRLHPDYPAYTITGSGGGGTHVYHHEEYRALTNRERARLQTFEDAFEFSGSKESVRRQIGMAIPPKGVRHIIDAIFKTLDGLSYNSVEPYFNLADEDSEFK